MGQKYFPNAPNLLKSMAGTTGLEPATSDVTGRRSNQLNYVPALAGKTLLYHERHRSSNSRVAEIAL
jgi:hypothetical protein